MALSSTDFPKITPNWLQGGADRPPCPLDIEKELLSSTTKFTLLDSLRQDSDLSIKAYSLLQEVCINCFKSKYMLVF